MSSDPQQTNTPPDRGPDEVIAELRAIKAKLATAPADEKLSLEVDLAIKARQFDVYIAQRDRRARVREILEAQQSLFRKQQSCTEQLIELFSDADHDLGFLVGLLERQLQELSARFDKELQQRKD